MVECLCCGEDIDTGHYKDEGEKDGPFDTFDKGNPHISLRLRRGFRDVGVKGARLHLDCAEEVLDLSVDLPEWAEE